MSMPKPVGPNMAAATPSGRREPRRRRSSTPDCSSWTPSHPPPESVLTRARRGRSLPWCGGLTFRTPTRHRAPDQEPGRMLIPGDGAAGDQGAQNRPACLLARRWRLRAACGLSRLNHFLTLWSQPYMPSCNRRVTSTSIHMARPGPASAPHGHAPLFADILSLARTVSERRFFARNSVSAGIAVGAQINHSGVFSELIQYQCRHADHVRPR